LAISFGAQSLVKDIIAGFFFLFEGQFAVGDVIEVAGRSGVVERMTLRVVMLRDANGVLHIVPNGQITSVSNMTRTWSRAVVDVGVAYGTDVDKALEVFRTRPIGSPRMSTGPRGSTAILRWSASTRSMRARSRSGPSSAPMPDSSGQ
jgi:small-conductance mechanosensitive channel